MSFFSKGQIKDANYVYNNMKKYLKPKDGKKHVVMINSFSKFVNQIFGCEDKYTVQLETLITNMQDEGYEILDIKFNSLMNQGIFGDMEGFNTLIIYR